MLSGTELEILKGVADRGGKSTIWIIGGKLGMSSDYARICCTSMGIADYIDLDRAGRVEITPKGWQELDKRGWQKEEEEARKPKRKECPYCGGSNLFGAVWCVECKHWLTTEEETHTVEEKTRTVRL